MVQVRVVDGQAGQGGLAQLLPVDLLAVAQVDAGDAHPGGEDVVGGDVGKLQGGLDELALLALQGALVLDGLDHGLEVVLGHAGLLPGGVEELLQAVADGGEDGRHGGQKGHQGIKRPRYSDGESVRVGLGEVLGDGLAQDEDGQGHDDGGVDGAIGAKPMHRQNGGGGGGQNVYHVVAHQNGHQGLVKPGEDLLHPGRARLSVLHPAFHPYPVAVGQGRLRPGEEAAQQHQQDHQNTSGDYVVHT